LIYIFAAVVTVVRSAKCGDIASTTRSMQATETSWSTKINQSHSSLG